jgi:hypothetical protein
MLTSEQVEKVDITPKSSNRTSNGKPVGKPQLKISLLPKEQAVIYMELDFILQQTANGFLQAQWNEARLSPDALNKVVSRWGVTRPTVKQFMYDAFRFHGEHANNKVKVSAVLSSWETVAKQMTVRTHCDRDFILWKLVHDVRQILEILGAEDATMLCVQGIESKVMMRMKNEEQQKAYSSQPSNDFAFGMGITPEHMVQPNRGHYTQPYDNVNLVLDGHRWNG